MDSLDAATDVTDNFKQIKESMSNVVCQDEQLERKMLDAQKNRSKSEGRNKENSPEKDFVLNLNLPMCLTDVDIFYPRKI